MSGILLVDGFYMILVIVSDVVGNQKNLLFIIVMIDSMLMVLEIVLVVGEDNGVLDSDNVMNYIQFKFMLQYIDVDVIGVIVNVMYNSVIDIYQVM